MVRIHKLLYPRARAIRRADAARDRQDPAAAARLYKLVIDTWGSTFGLQVQLGNALKDSGAYDDAELTYRAALELKPGDADCHLQLGHLMKLAGRFDDAKALYLEANRLDPALPGPIAELATIKARESFLPTPTPRDEVSSRASSHSKSQSLSEDIPSYDILAAVIKDRIIGNLKWRRN